MITEYFKHQKIIKCKDTNEICKGYEKYLRSKHWLSLRKQLIHKNTVCEICNKKVAPLQLHHKTYRNLGNESVKDFLILCEDCHKFVHKQKDLINNTSHNKKSKKKKKATQVKRTCKNCKSFSKIKYINKKALYCQYYGKLYPKKVCDKFRLKK